MNTELSHGATVWLLVTRDSECADVRVFASQAAARKTIDAFLSDEQKNGRNWTYAGDISECGVGFEWLSEGMQLILTQSIVRR